MKKLSILEISSFLLFAVSANPSNLTTILDDYFHDRLEEIFNDDLKRHWSPEDEEHAQNLHPIFDFIIIGSGPAGSVIANRLTENPNWNVLLLEAGRVPIELSDIPMFQNLLQFTNHNWGYLAEKQADMGLGLENQRMHWPRGKALGGSTVINGMVHIRGNRLEYDRWAAKGNKGWSYREVLPYFKKSEDYLVKIQDPQYHRQGGCLGVQDVRFRTKSAQVFVDAMQEFGYKYVDYNGGQQIGVSFVHATQRNSRRSSAYNAFIRPILHRKNLVILTETRVLKILIDPRYKRAYGVHFARNGENFIARASKDVILSAGVMNSPQLLMLSGIGPGHHLEELGIPVLQNLPVGQKLYDHLAFRGLVFTVNESITFDASALQSPQSYIEFFNEGKGPLSSINVVEALGIIKTPISVDPDPSYPDIELIFSGGSFHTDRGGLSRRAYRISDETYNAVWKPLEGKQAFSIYPMLYHPRSFGFVTLKSKNPYNWPRFHANYLSDPENFDVKTLIASIRFVQQLIKMPAFRRYSATLWDVPLPGCEHYLFNSDAYWECALRHIALTVHHQVGTCKMGPPTDLEAVVDDELKVYGVGNLRVADTSIIPEPLSAHTSVPAYMIGEKASDLIKQFWLHH